MTTQTPIDWETLARTSAAMRQRLEQIVEREDPFFVLTGESPDVPQACCVSDDVGDAERLVAAGILDRWQAPAPEGVCPTTTYAFRGEITSGERRPSFKIDPEFRRQVLAALHETPPSKRWIWVRWLLLAFVAVSIVWALAREPAIAPMESARVEPSELPSGRAVVLYLFRNFEGCVACRRMEGAVKQAFEELPEAWREEDRVIFRNVYLENQVDDDLRQRYQIAGTVLLLVEFEDGREVDNRPFETGGTLPDQDRLARKVAERVTQRLAPNEAAPAEAEGAETQ